MDVFMGVQIPKVWLLLLNKTMKTNLLVLLRRMDTSECLFYLRFPREDCDALLAQGIEDSFVVEAGVPVDWDKLHDWLTQKEDWVLGWIGYDVRRSIERFGKEKLRASAFPQIALIRPTNLFKIRGAEVEVIKGTWHASLNTWLSMQPAEVAKGVELKPVVSHAEYLEHIAALKRHIAVGNVYELNYCMPFEARVHLTDAPSVWKHIYHQTKAPFSAYAQVGAHHVMCASPERYLKREGNRVISQPIKGTVRRGQTPEEDTRLKDQLGSSRKERAENVMIVDLVRNDLSRCAERDSVQVEELFGVHSFKTVHHLVSTIRCDVAPETSWVDLIKATFPMGSMTGAPKLSAMQLIAQHEETERGIYSGSIGYIEPGGDFDFNVVIRSVQYDAASQLASCHVGGAITALCEAEDEYNECLLKAEAVLRALRG
jgi:para-aminobenzoate synthetase component 1